jgi:hypothetical protein
MSKLECMSLTATKADSSIFKLTTPLSGCLTVAVKVKLSKTKVYVREPHHFDKN